MEFAIRHKETKKIIARAISWYLIYNKFKRLQNNNLYEIVKILY